MGRRLAASVAVLLAVAGFYLSGVAIAYAYSGDDVRTAVHWVFGGIFVGGMLALCTAGIAVGIAAWVRWLRHG